MTEEDVLKRDVDRAVHAKTLIEDELLAEAFAALKRDYIEAWEGSQPRDTDGRERLWQALQIVGKVEAHLHSVYESGALAQKEIDNLQRMGERRKVFGIV